MCDTLEASAAAYLVAACVQRAAPWAVGSGCGGGRGFEKAKVMIYESVFYCFS